MVFQLKENKIEARQFAGGTAEINSLISWLKSNGLNAFLQSIGRSPKMKINDTHGNASSAQPTEWIVQLPNGRYNIWTDAAFKAHFEQFDSKAADALDEANNSADDGGEI